LFDKRRFPNASAAHRSLDQSILGRTAGQLQPADTTLSLPGFSTGFFSRADIECISDAADHVTRYAS
jgi:hypothetical protein